MTNTKQELRERYKRFCRTEEAANNLVNDIEHLIFDAVKSEVNKVLDELEKTKYTLSTGATIIPPSAIEQVRKEYK